MFGLSERFDKPPPVYEPGPGHYTLKPRFGKEVPKDLTTQLVEKIYKNSPLQHRDVLHFSQFIVSSKLILNSLYAI